MGSVSKNPICELRDGEESRRGQQGRGEPGGAELKRVEKMLGEQDQDPGGRTSYRRLGMGHLPDMSFPGPQVWSWAPSLRVCCEPTCFPG